MNSILTCGIYKRLRLSQVEVASPAKRLGDPRLQALQSIVTHASEHAENNWPVENPSDS
jgi:hypothetical protein